MVWDLPDDVCTLERFGRAKGTARNSQRVLVKSNSDAKSNQETTRRSRAGRNMSKRKTKVRRSGKPEPQLSTLFSLSHKPEEDQKTAQNKIACVIKSRFPPTPLPYRSAVFQGSLSATDMGLTGCVVLCCVAGQDSAALPRQPQMVIFSQRPGYMGTSQSGNRIYCGW